LSFPRGAWGDVRIHRRWETGEAMGIFESRWWLWAGALLLSGGCAQVAGIDNDYTLRDAGGVDSGGHGGSTTTTSGNGGTGGTGGSGAGGETGTPVVKGAFVSGAVQPGGGAVQVRGQLAWQARVSGGNGAVQVKGWLR
jgi:hypothetical protein